MAKTHTKFNKKGRRNAIEMMHLSRESCTEMSVLGAFV